MTKNIVTVLGLAALAFIAACPGIVQAQSEQDIQDLEDADRSLERMIAVLTGCTDRILGGDLTIVEDCMTVLNQLSDEIDRIMTENSEIVNGIVFG